MKTFAAFVGGLLTGAVGGYFVAKKVYVKAKEEEIASVEEAFKKRYSQNAEEKIPSGEKSENKEERPTELKPKKYDHKDYTQYSKEVTKYTSDEQVVADIERAVKNGYHDAQKEFQGRIVTREEYLDNAEDYGQESLTYYEGDKTLADFHNDIFEETEYLPSEFVEHFDDGFVDKRYDQDVVYVVNDDLEMSYEITKDERAFKDVVRNLE